MDNVITLPLRGVDAEQTAASKLAAGHGRAEAIRQAVSRTRRMRETDRRRIAENLGPVADVVEKAGWRNLRLVKRAMTGVGTPAEITP
jgi:hypothetical protein